MAQLEHDLRERPTRELLRSIAGDSATLVRKELELGRQEILDAVSARLAAAASMATAGAFGLVALIFLAVAAAAALDLVLPLWAAALIVAGAFGVVALGGLTMGIWRAKRPPLLPEETARTIKEDVEWAKTQLRR